MKKITILILLLLPCMSLFSNQFPELSVYFPGNPRNIHSNVRNVFAISFSNSRTGITYENIVLSVEYEGHLEISLDRSRIDIINPGESLTVYMEVINDRNYFFDEPTYISVRISNEDNERIISNRFTIKTMENFWLYVISSFSVVLILIFIVLYIKLNKGEENA